ncbi:hypothetical protein BX661DRAFT_177035 [Kickxella alabastrina]|uniref:uncharacterized protein n=1 Tax=Kickxella alabastrina TaxID=61397 RepID=UPI00221EF511|nr:uncharacterized protein BX661DRAFT_177035 [Kickxella alabastrina]KAI7834339.1 hypothetical protein BX661DRAFT_177035 [Kickxella alabastrina]
MKEAAAAIQDLMRDTAHLFDQARKLNSQLLQIDTFVSNEETRTLLRDLDKCKRQFKVLAVMLESETIESDTLARNSDAMMGGLQRERDRLYEEAVDKAEQIRKLLDCVRQIQLTSAQLLQI